MHNTAMDSYTNHGVMRLRKKKETPNPREFRDPPVPPVKGAVNQAQDVLLRPDAALQAARPTHQTQEAVHDQWL